MNPKRFLSLTLGSLILVLLAGLSAAPVAANDLRCQGQFEGTVRSGPNAGLSLVGDLKIEVDASGSVEGVLILGRGSRLEVSGRISGGSIELTFDLGDGTSARGMGRVDNPFSCTGASGGSLVGPLPGDRGDWGIIWGS